MRVFLLFLKLFLAVGIVFAVGYLRTPFMADVRGVLFLGVVVLGAGLIWLEADSLRRGYLKKTKIISFLIVAIAGLGLVMALGIEGRFNYIKQGVFNSEPAKLEKLGRHFIIGYRNFEELKLLVEKKAIGGVFITTRNVKGKSIEEIKQEIEILQAMRRSQGLSPLWVAADQEGGPVSRLSPPLVNLPALSQIVGGNKEGKKDAVIEYASLQGKGLAEMGVNLNLAPVVDLNKGIVNPNDKYSQIYRRAISGDKNIVAEVALWYCNTLEKYQVKCAIKHFPGLGKVEDDTHLQAAELQASLSELTADDWVPFRRLMIDSKAFVMLGHAKLMAVDSEYPVSFSQKVVAEMIRKDWGFDGVLITDDFGMQAVYGSKDGLSGAVVKAVNAGVDLILVSFDHDLYYPAMDALLKAAKAGVLEGGMLERSKKRLEEATFFY
ncbi:glycoside hydrolase family 3 protein [Ancylothrix sp. C2]|uniref:glycoside hydrolase family 3 N-terminal domain-containing protein n=1 Tax=Ancylothrix sp. D3o TaxID=2953691 RepID=UPI0021BB4212|nr:glycoside hydrolase family 3 N-terminal domain-containing protein [Ancylothrix sp. D3o]MCT7949061.1 glycoside hydrolase family 3 protein [Ancylothrix sp. D3o]